GAGARTPPTAGSAPMSDRRPAASACAGLLLTAVAVVAVMAPVRRREHGRGRSLAAQEARELDPGAWGGDHVGRPVPAYGPGDECLFCHRMDIGPGFAGNRHNLTIRPIDEGPDALQALRGHAGTKGVAGDVVYLLGGPRRQRYLRPSREYGRLEMLS